jgi:uncharacterized membrane protein/predicted DsbA family dithiol-disulfide isomerase
MKAQRLLLAFVALGLAASGYATYVHYRLLNDPTYLSFCDVSATVSCTEAYASRFGSLFGVPVALLGLLWFVLVLLLAWPAARSRDRSGFASNADGYLFVLATVALSFILYLAYGAFFVLKVVCLLCVTTYVAVIGIFLISGMSASFPMTTLPRRLAQDVRRATPRALVTIGIFLAAAVSAVAFFPHESAAGGAASAPPPAATEAQTSELERFMATSPRVPLVVPADGAKVLIVKFNDFQCPACGQSYLAYKPIFAKYEASHPGAVKVVMKDFPLNPNCNPNLVNMVHPSACDAAVAVRLATMQGKGVAMEEWLYTHQATMTPASVREAAKEIGGVTNFDAMYNSTIELVKADTALGRQLGVRSTPTFFIDGVKVEGAWAPQFFDAAIAYELRRAGVANP